MTPFDFAPAPQRLDRYGSLVQVPPTRLINQKVCHQFAQEFFKGAVRRGQERRKRIHDLEARLEELSLPSDQEQLWAQSAHLEAKYFRLLRTTPSRFTSIRPIAKGHSHDLTLVRSCLGDRVYVLKRTVKQPSDARGYDPPIFCGHSPVSDWSWSHNNSHKEQSEWITTLYTTYVDNLARCELLEFAPGGDLLSRLIQTQTLPENTTRLLAAEILMAIRARHLTSYTYGNIRPENILIGRDGHIKLSSCGVFMSHDQLSHVRTIQADPTDTSVDNWDLTEINKWRRYRRTIAHSEHDLFDYLAPESFTGIGFSHDVDWWALGVIIYECLLGRPPFFTDTPERTVSKIKNSPDCLAFPDNTHLSPESIQLIKCLLSELQTRPTYDDLTSHPFFAGIDLTTLRQGPGPFPPPDLASGTDTSYYPPEEFILPDDELRGDKGPAAYWDLDMDLDQDTEIPDFRLPFLGPFLGHTFQWFEKTFG